MGDLSVCCQCEWVRANRGSEVTPRLELCVRAPLIDPAGWGVKHDRTRWKKGDEADLHWKGSDMKGHTIRRAHLLVKDLT